MMKKVMTVLILVCVMAGESISAMAAPTVFIPGQECPVMTAERAKSKFHWDYKGTRYYFCCRPCVKSFKKNPEKYLKKNK